MFCSEVRRKKDSVKRGRSWLFFPSFFLSNPSFLSPSLSLPLQPRENNPSVQRLLSFPPHVYYVQSVSDSGTPVTESELPGRGTNHLPWCLPAKLLHFDHRSFVASDHLNHLTLHLTVLIIPPWKRSALGIPHSGPAVRALSMIFKNRQFVPIICMYSIPIYCRCWSPDEKHVKKSRFQAVSMPSFSFRSRFYICPESNAMDTHSFFLPSNDHFGSY